MSKSKGKMVIILSYSGHYPDKYVRATKEEVKKLKQLTAKHYLFDTPEGREILKELESRPPIHVFDLEVIAYQ